MSNDHCTLCAGTGEISVRICEHGMGVCPCDTAEVPCPDCQPIWDEHNPQDTWGREYERHDRNGRGSRT